MPPAARAARRKWREPPIDTISFLMPRRLRFHELAAAWRADACITFAPRRRAIWRATLFAQRFTQPRERFAAAVHPFSLSAELLIHAITLILPPLLAPLAELAISPRSFCCHAADDYFRLFSFAFH
jgi:hypothetical protein